MIFTVMMIPGIWAMTQFDASRKFMIAQGKPTMPMIIQLVTMIMHYLWCLLLVGYLDLRIEGTAIATNITFILNMAFSDLILMTNQDFEKTRNLRSWKDLFEGWLEYLMIGIPGAIMLCGEWWAFEILAILSGCIGVADLAAEIIIISFVTFVFMIPLGLSLTASSLTGNCLGEQNVPLAKRFANIAMSINLVLVIIVIILLTAFNYQIIRVFSTDPEVVDITQNALVIVIFYLFLDAIHGVQSGVIKGLGLQRPTALMVFITHYLIGMPLAVAFAFWAKMGVSGLWLGFTIAAALLDIEFYFLISRADWN